MTRTANAALGFIEDYCWTSMHLFGQCNGPLFITGLRDNAEAAIDAAQEAGLQQPFAAGNYFFHDSWMNGAGFGKWSLGKNTKACCGATQAAKKVLSTLSGTLKGGLFLCTENLTNLDAGYLTVNNADWEDQFFCCRDSQNDAHFGTWSSAGDFDQTDLWQDGGLELNTRDCISGTWSIRLCNDFFVKVYKAVTPEEIEALADGYPITQHVEAAAGLYNVVGAIKGSVLKLDKSAKFIETGSGNKEIFTIVQPGSAEKLPSVTPKFAQHFGLANWL